MLEPPVNADEQFWITPQPYADLIPRDGEGRGTEAQAATRRLRVLEMYANLTSAPAIIQFVTGLNYKLSTAKEDLKWAKARWLEMQDTTETAYDIIQRHTAKYYEWASLAEQAGENKQAADMLGRIERLRGLHAPTVAVSVNNGTINNTTIDNFNLGHLNLEELQQLHLLAAKIAPADA